jgi:hypothetical protein
MPKETVCHFPALRKIVPDIIQMGFTHHVVKKGATSTIRHQHSIMVGSLGQENDGFDSPRFLPHLHSPGARGAIYAARCLCSILGVESPQSCPQVLWENPPPHFHILK